MTTLIAALDQGTTSSLAIIFDKAGAIAGIAQQHRRHSWKSEC